MSGGDLAAAAQNPIANNISLPFENTVFAKTGAQEDTTYVLSIQPVIPMRLSDDWNLIHRPIVPIMDVPGAVDGIPEIDGQPVGTDDTFGLGDINVTSFFSPRDSGRVIWGVGPSLTLPTATADEFGSGKWSLGPSAVALTISRPWLVGLLWRQLWSVEGPSDRADVNQMMVQPFVNYNLADGWYLITAPIFLADFEAQSSERWTVPIGGGVGKLIPTRTPLNINVQYYHNVETPDLGPEWQIKLVVQLVFPK